MLRAQYDHHLHALHADLLHMGRQVVAAVGAALVQRDVAGASHVAVDEAVVDQLTAEVYTELLARLGEPAHVESALRLLFVTHNLERVADRATTIAERVIFVVTNRWSTSSGRARPSRRSRLGTRRSGSGA